VYYPAETGLEGPEHNFFFSFRKCHIFWWEYINFYWTLLEQLSFADLHNIDLHWWLILESELSALFNGDVKLNCVSTWIVSVVMLYAAGSG